MISNPDKVKIVISDCHLSAGRVYDGKLNPHEDFFYDDEMIDLFTYFSTGRYGGELDVELIIAGDYFDFLNVPIDQDFTIEVTEAVSLRKLDAIMKGHSEVMDALRTFVSQPNKTITFLIGNHDADLFFPKIREAIVRRWDPEGRYPSDKVKIVADKDRLRYEGGVEIRHGNQLEAGSNLDFSDPFDLNDRGEQILELPWSSVYVLKVISRLKFKREFLDKIRPVRVYVVFGLIFDTFFTLSYIWRSLRYFVRTRFFRIFRRGKGLRQTFQILREESRFFQNLEEEARRLLDEDPSINTIIMGHTHLALDKIYPDGKQYINTGTWTKMVLVDWRSLGLQHNRTFALIEIKDGKASCDLRTWVGEHSPHKAYGH